MPQHTIVERGARHILFHGLAMVLAGLLWGFVVPATRFPRLALTAHIEFTSNGLLFLVLAILLLTVAHSVGLRSIAVMLCAAWLTWILLATEVANAWWGTTEILPLAAAQAGATGGNRGRKQSSSWPTSWADWAWSALGRY